MESNLEVFLGVLHYNRGIIGDDVTGKEVMDKVITAIDEIVKGSFDPLKFSFKATEAKKLSIQRRKEGSKSARRRSRRRSKNLNITFTGSARGNKRRSSDRKSKSRESDEGSETIENLVVTNIKSARRKSLGVNNRKRRSDERFLRTPRKMDSRKINDLDDQNILTFLYAEKQHNFEPKSSTKPRNCEHCHKSIWGINKKHCKCIDCGMIVHKSCSIDAYKDCTHMYGGTYLPHSMEDVKKIMSTFCNICRNSLVTGYKCKVCKFACHEECLEFIPNDCPPLASVSENHYRRHRHFWIAGNRKGRCMTCNTPVHRTTHLSGFRCFWCHQTVCSNKCRFTVEMSLISSNCYGGKFKDYSLPPFAVYTNGSNDIADLSIDVQKCKSVTPLIVILEDDDALFKDFTDYLNPIQIITVDEFSRNLSLVKVMSQYEDLLFSIVLFGSERTLSDVLYMLQESEKPPEKYPFISLISDTKENDCSRTLGVTLKEKDKAKKFLYLHKEETTMDLWKMERFNEGDNIPVDSFLMYGHFAICGEGISEIIEIYIIDKSITEGSSCKIFYEFEDVVDTLILSNLAFVNGEEVLSDEKSISDGVLEMSVCALGSPDLGQINFKKHLIDFLTVEEIEIVVKEPINFRVDGHQYPCYLNSGKPSIIRIKNYHKINMNYSTEYCHPAAILHD
eukprot:TRINITY_DN4754_c0_g1_i2.p1 TRINITY_DN4754_c0_g1~~TRINITY_DN4754_c0_g1_i2.p1  ORF type:complete len:677 (+),score=119.06 TRINITY_DN4754_c0_g1_i2:42-2072(+)